MRKGRSLKECTQKYAYIQILSGGQQPTDCLKVVVTTYNWD